MEHKLNCPKCKAEISAPIVHGKGVITATCKSCNHEFKLAQCPHCASTNVYGMSRVVGYYSKIDNWNKSKTAEFRDRQKGDYDI